MFLEGETPEGLAKKILGDDCKILSQEDASFECDCSKEKYAKILVTLKPIELREMIEKDHGAELTCRFCGNQYNYSEDDLKKILADQKNN